MNEEKLIQTMEQTWASSELTSLNSSYLESLYEQYLDDPASVDLKIKVYFDQAGKSLNFEQKHSEIQEKFRKMNTAAAPMNSGISASSRVDSRYPGILNLVRAYRQWGHLKANLDPLKQWTRPLTPELSLAYHGLSERDLDQSFPVSALGFSTESLSLKNILAQLESWYCGSFGVEYEHIIGSEERKFIQARLETSAPESWSIEAQQALLKSLISADALEKYLGMKYAGQKRFSLEGADALIPLVQEVIEESSKYKVEQISMGMAHRGRLNVLVNILGKAPKELCSEFEGKYANKLISGDVKYHNGFSSELNTSVASMQVSLAFNPSHLEIVSPVVEGSVRARQARKGDDRNRVMALHIHGDAAFSGQGVVMETLAMSQTRAYHTGGSIHIIVNNQVGFTTSQIEDARSSLYCSDIAKMTDCPIFHVNSEDPEQVLRLVRLALAYRMKFHKDVVIDLVSYRLHGHNEADEAAATQPRMASIIKQKQAPWEIYAQSLEKKACIQAGQALSWFKQYQEKLEQGLPVASLKTEASSESCVSWKPYLNQVWTLPYADKTKIDLKKLREVAQTLESLPADFNLQRQVAKMLQDRHKMTQGELAINWGYAEILAYATLLNEGTFIRFTGEDVERGTFAHRHAVLHDQVSGETFTPLSQISPGKFVIHNSLLSELAVLAFEYGFSSAYPQALVIWEAQFGDFVNMAQPIIDQFIAAAEEKWARLSGLMMLLPHGFEGMGAEHSSARLERFLQLCANDNIQVCVPTTPAQIFHLIRRQVLRAYRKPLVVMSPKSLLRHPECVSSLEDLCTGEYQVVIPEKDPEIQAKIGKVRRVVLCQGKVYFDLLAERKLLKITDIALIRIEQLYPFPAEALAFVMKSYTQVKEVMWCQEEPKNQGAWNIIRQDIEGLLSKTQRLSYAGRAAFASPATGYSSLHKEQQAALIRQALNF